MEADRQSYRSQQSGNSYHSGGHSQQNVFAEANNYDENDNFYITPRPDGKDEDEHDDI